MNEKIAIKITFGIILLVFVSVSVLFLVQKGIEISLRTDYRGENKQPADNKSMPSSSAINTTSKADEVLINRGRGLEKINIITKKVSSVKDPYFANLSEYAGLSREFITKDTSVKNSILLVSEDKSRMIVVSNTYDQTKKPSEFDGSLPNLKSEEFVCETATKKCSATDILASSYKGTGLSGTWYGNRSLWWYNWDSVKNLLYGHLTGEGIGNAAPVYIFDINNNSIKKTTGYDANGEGKRAEVPQGAFSPSLKKFVMIDENVGLDAKGNAKYGSWDFLLYNSDDLSKPSKKINVSQMQKDGTEYDRIGSIAWLQDESLLAVATEGQIFTLDLTNGQIELKFVYSKKVDNSEWFDFNKIDLSQSGRYITFLVSEKAKKGEKSDSNGNVGVLQTIDLKNNNKVTEILRDPEVTLFY